MVWPTPQQVTARPGQVTVPRTVVVLATEPGANADVQIAEVIPVFAP